MMLVQPGNAVFWLNQENNRFLPPHVTTSGLEMGVDIFSLSTRLLWFAKTPFPTLSLTVSLVGKKS